MPAITYTDIENARTRTSSRLNQTPLLSSRLLNEWLGHEIYFKAEGFQKIGAFKSRGALNTLAWLKEQKQLPQRVVANSSGNHAQAVAWSAKQFGLPVTIFMPAYTSAIKVQATKAYGAEVVLSPTRNETDERVKQAAAEAGTYWIPPFNHPQVMAGQGTAAAEALEDLPDVDAVFAPCGGGGLLSGTLIATRKLAPKAEVVGVEPLQANDAAESIRQGAIQRLPAIPETLADGAMTMAVGDLTFPLLQQLDAFYEVAEPKIIYWTQWLTHLLKVRIEPTCAMTMEGGRQWLKHKPKKQRVLVILSGGNIDQPTMLKLWEKNKLEVVPRL